MLDELVTLLLGALVISLLIVLSATAALAVGAACWAAAAALRRRHADRRLEQLRQRHYEEVRARARRPFVELDPVDFGDWPVLDGEPPVVFPAQESGMSRDPTVAELVDRLAAARLAELVRENRELRARLAATPARPAAPASAARPAQPPPAADTRPRLRVVRGEAAR